MYAPLGLSPLKSGSGKSITLADGAQNLIRSGYAPMVARQLYRCLRRSVPKRRAELVKVVLSRRPYTPHPMLDVEICPEILEVAVEKLSRIGGSSAPRSLDEWTIVRHKRERSTVYRLTDSNSDTTLFYKVLSSTRYRHSDSLSNRLNRTESLTDRLLDVTSGTSVSPAPVLAADAHRRTLVTLGVEGREIRGGILRGLLPGQTLSSRQAALIGQGCAHIERCSEDEEVIFDLERFTRQVEKRLIRAQTDRRAKDHVRSQLDEAASDLLARQIPVYIHGDLSPTNIIVSGPSVYLIDFSWFSGFPGYDLGLFSYRLRAMDKILWGRGPRLRKSLMTAYRSASGSRYESLSLKLVNLFLLVRGLGSPWPKMRVLAQGALDRVISDPWEDEGDFQWWWENTK